MNIIDETETKPNLLRLKLAGYFSLFGLFFFGAIFSLPILAFGKNVSITAAIISTVIAEIVLVLVAIFYAKEQKYWKSVLGLKNPGINGITSGVLFGFLAFFGLQIVSQILANFLHLESESSDTSNSIAQVSGSSRTIVLLILVPFLVPLIEELVFRGYILGFFLKGYEAPKNIIKNSKVIFSILITSIYFGAVHIQGFSSYTDIFIPIWVFIISIGFAVLRVKFNSIFASFAAHATYNLMTSILIILMT